MLLSQQKLVGEERLIVVVLPQTTTQCTSQKLSTISTFSVAAVRMIKMIVVVILDLENTEKVIENHSFQDQ